MIFALKLFGIGKTIMGLFTRFIGWLFEDWLRLLVAGLCLVIAGLCVLSAVLWFTGHRATNDRDKALAGWKSEISAHKQTVANYRAASQAATDAAVANKVRVETKYVEIENAQDKNIRARLDAALSKLRSRKTATDTSGADAVSMPFTPNAAVDPAGAGGRAVMDDDAVICTANTVKAQGWLDWYEQVRAVEQVDTQPPIG